MAKRLQKFGHREVDYDRPNQKWQCGHSVDGRVCPLGPGARGQCRGTGECLPIRKGDRWLCTRPESQGGECEIGPGPDGGCGCPLPPCQPVRSLRQVRFLVSLGAVSLTIGFLFLVLGGDRRDAAINPGRLTTAHAGENLDCRSCHTESSISQLATVIDPHFLRERAVNNSRLCLECHGEEIGEWEDSARFAHGWNGDERTRVSKKFEESPPAPVSDTQLAVWFASKLPARDEGIRGTLACSICHQEHHGASASLTELTDQQCQVCHQQPFHGFGDGHPSFAGLNYPYSRRTRIYFDHEKHYRDHFKQRTPLMADFESSWPPADGQSCRECHETDQQGQFMRLKGFEASCGKCHDESFARGGTRLTLLAIPETGDPGVGGKWPASGHGLIPPMRLVLGEEARQAVDALEPVDVENGLEKTEIGLEKAKIRLQNEEQFGEVWLNASPRREAAEVVAADLQDFFYGVWNEGSEQLIDRLRENGFLAPENSPGLFQGLPAQAFGALLFPGAEGTLADFAFPRIDLKTLNAKLAEKKNRSIGLWPKTNFNLTPVMIRLLSHRSGIENELRLLILKDDDNNGRYWPEKDGKIYRQEDGSIRLGDLSGASEAELFAVEKVAWAIREIRAGIEPEDAPFFKQFLRLHGGILDLEDPDSVLEQVFAMANRDEAFMAGYEAELAAYREGKYPAAKEEKTPVPADPKKGDSNQDDDFGAPAAKPADDDFGAPAAKPADDDFGAPAAKPADDDFGAPAAKPADDDFGAPAAKPADDDFGAPAAKPADDDFGAPAAKPADGEGGQPAAVSRSFDVSELTDVASWQHSGGWHYDGHAIYYASQGHADPVIRAWIESSVAAVNSEDSKVREDGRRILEHTLQWKDGVKSEASGRCLDCHTIDRNAGSGKLQVNWFGAFGTPDQTRKSTALTRFSHAKHFIALDCLQCHAPREDGEYVNFFPNSGVDPFETSDPEKFSPNFHPMNEQTQCANCHQAEKAGSSCLQCHSYHNRRP